MSMSFLIWGTHTPPSVVFDARHTAEMLIVDDPNFGARVMQWDAAAPHTGLYQMTADAAFIQSRSVPQAV